MCEARCSIERQGRVAGGEQTWEYKQHREQGIVMAGFCHPCRCSECCGCSTPIMNFNDQDRYCHAERSEASLCPSRETLRCAQGDRTLPILIVKVHHWGATQACR